jgi:hypothetical protein
VTPVDHEHKNTDQRRDDNSGRQYVQPKPKCGVVDAELLAVKTIVLERPGVVVLRRSGACRLQSGVG